MYFLYIDESGYTGKRLNDLDQPVLAMAGLLIYHSKWKKSWKEFENLCNSFTKKFGVNFSELKASDVYNGRNKWKNVSANDRHEILEYCTNWMENRKHKIIASVICKKDLEKERDLIKQLLFPLKYEFSERTPYLLCAVYITLMFQRYLETMSAKSHKNLGMVIFDEQKEEKNALKVILESPPSYLEGFTKEICKKGFSCIMDNAYSISSKYANYIQLADIAAFIIRKKAELQYLKKESYPGEQKKISHWFSKIINLHIEKRHGFPQNCEFVSFYKKITIDIFK